MIKKLLSHQILIRIFKTKSNKKIKDKIDKENQNRKRKSKI